MSRNEQVLEAIARDVRAILSNYRLSDIKVNHTKHFENAIKADIETAVNKFYYQGKVQKFYFELIPIAVPQGQLPSREERVARIMMGLPSYPAAYACRLGVEFVDVACITILVNSETERTIIQPS